MAGGMLDRLPNTWDNILCHGKIILHVKLAECQRAAKGGKNVQ